MSKTSSKKPGAKKRALAWFAITAIVIYSLLGFLIVPAILKWHLLKLLPDLTHRQAAVERVKMNPYALSLAISGFSLKETNGEPFAAFDEFYVNFQLSSLFRRAWTFREIKLTHPTGNIVRNSNGEFNFANLFTNAPAPASTPKPKTEMPVVLVQSLVVTNGNISVTDHTRAHPFQTAYGPVDVVLKDFTTQRDRDEPYSFVATTRDGERFAWSGKISVNPPRSFGEFKLLGIPLKKYSSYLAGIAQVDLADGVLGVSADYRLEASSIPLELDVTNAAVTLSNLAVKESANGATLLTLKEFSVTNASVSLARQEALLPLLAINGGTVFARRETNGQVNWLSLLNPQVDTPPAPASVANNVANSESKPWKAMLQEFTLKDFDVSIEDRTLAVPVAIGLDKLAVKVKGVSTESNAPVTAEVSFNWRAGGTVNVTAQGTLIPPAAAANLAISNFALPPVQPYLEPHTSLVLNEGDLSLNGSATYKPGATPIIRFDGDLSVARFATIETVTYSDFLKWDDLTLRGIELSLQTNALNVEEIKFTKLQTSVVVSSNGQLNLQGLVRQKASVTNDSAPPVATATSATEEESFPIKVGALVLNGSSVHAVDQSLAPRFQTSIEEFNGTISDITLPGLTKAKVDLHGKISALAPFAVVGSITPNATNPFVDLKIKFENSDLTPYDPYSGKFVGRPLNKGKLFLDLHYLIEDRNLKAENIVAIDQLTFGPRNGNTNATQLPVKLAVSLMKDRKGRIDLNIPLSGSLDDPEFSVGKLVVKVLVNLLTKAATSPFALLGAVLGGDGEELQFVDFADGEATIDAAQTNKLEKLSKALYERPDLNLEISASANFFKDSESLAKKKLHGKLRALYFEELTVAGKPLPVADQFKVEGEEYDRLLRRAYTNAFGPLPEAAAATPSVVVPAPNPEPNEIVAIVPVKAATPKRVREIAKGAMALKEASSIMPEKELPTPIVTNVAISNPPPNAMIPTVEQAVGPTLRAEWEQKLLSMAPATEDDLRQLLQDRVESIQKFLLGTERVTADRLFLIAPKKVDPAIDGKARAIFALD